MEKRLVGQGPKKRKSYTVTLPIDWVKQQKLDKKLCVDLSIVGNKIVIAPQKVSLDSVHVDATIYIHTLVKVLQGLYRQGIDEILITGTEKTMTEVLSIVETRMIGYELLEKKANSLLIKDITKESEEDFPIILRRIFLLTVELSESRSNAESVGRTISKLINYCQRILMKKGHTDYSKTPVYYLMLDRLEKIKDEYLWLYALSSTKKEKEIIPLLREAYTLFYAFNAVDYDAYANATFTLKKSWRINATNEPTMIHLHNIARILNSLYGDIYMVSGIA